MCTLSTGTCYVKHIYSTAVSCPDIRITGNDLGTYRSVCVTYTSYLKKLLAKTPKMHAVPPMPHTMRGSPSKEWRKWS